MVRMEFEELKKSVKDIIAGAQWDSRPVGLDAIASGREVETPSGRFYLIERHLSEFYDRHEEFLACYIEALSRRVPERHQHRDFRRFLRVSREGLLYLDIETGGTIGTPVFLIGTMFERGGSLRIQQLLARDYSEERAIIEHLAAMLDGFDMLVTYNGKTFDIPALVERARANGINFRPLDEHFDLLHEARRRWKRYLRDCRLRTIETRIRGVRRLVGEIPSEAIPRAFENYLKTGNTAPLRDILDHNALDLLSMAHMILTMLSEMA